jgi:hypothetical protein
MATANKRGQLNNGNLWRPAKTVPDRKTWKNAPRKTEQVKRLKDLELENSRLRKAVSDLTLDKLILQEAARGNF